MFLLAKYSFFEDKCSPINSFHLFFNFFYVNNIFIHYTIEQKWIVWCVITRHIICTWTCLYKSSYSKNLPPQGFVPGSLGQELDALLAELFGLVERYANLRQYYSFYYHRAYFADQGKVLWSRKLKTWTLNALYIPYVIESNHNLNLRL